MKFTATFALLWLTLLCASGSLISRQVFAATPEISTTSPWPQFGNDPAGTRRSSFVGPTSQPELKWKYQTGLPTNVGLERQLVYATPTLGDDLTVYVPSYDGNIHAINPDGSQKWTYPVGTRLRASATVASDGSLYHLSSQGLFSIDSAGVLQFQNTNYGNSDPSVTISADDKMYVGSGSKLFSLELDGTENWSLDVGGLVEGTPVVGSDGTIYFGSSDGVLNAVNDQGALQWTFPIPGRNAKGATIGNDGIIYAGGQSGDFFAINPDGTEKWRFSESDEIFTAAAVGLDDHVVFAARDGIYALDEDGDELWHYADESSAHGSVVIDARGNVFATRNHRVLGLDSSGDLMWEYALDPSADFIYSGITLDNSGVLYFGGADGVYAIAAHPIPEPSMGVMLVLTVACLGCRRYRNLSFFNETLRRETQTQNP